MLLCLALALMLLVILTKLLFKKSNKVLAICAGLTSFAVGSISMCNVWFGSQKFSVNNFVNDLGLIVSGIAMIVGSCIVLSLRRK
ncbi:MAG: hypothetical protein SFU85_03125 [Candidatus Methylacidiphilales bacterium]|nr:hypothetical protein [Candidatus Methylacidiphilales bacterium]